MNTQNELPSLVVEALHEALDDEYKAYAIYDAIINKFGQIRPFTNIIEAEVRHANAVKALMQKYHLNVPENPYLSGAKPLPEVPSTIERACEMGVVAEIENVALYQDKILPAVSDYRDITATMLNLFSASQNNHLPAFQRCVARQGGQNSGQGRGQKAGRRGKGLQGGGRGHRCRQ